VEELRNPKDQVWDSVPIFCVRDARGERKEGRGGKGERNQVGKIDRFSSVTPTIPSSGERGKKKRRKKKRGEENKQKWRASTAGAFPPYSQIILLESGGKKKRGEKRKKGKGRSVRKIGKAMTSIGGHPTHLLYESVFLA